jgi:glutamyl-tRNA synthetase
VFTKDKAFSTEMVNIDRESAKPRKDISKWCEIKDYYSYMFNEYYVPVFELPENIKMEDAKAILAEYLNVYDANDDKDTWFNKMKDVSEKFGFAREVKEYKKNPEAYKGHVGDVSTVVRVALTGRKNTPDLYEILKNLGKERIEKRFARI